MGLKIIQAASFRSLLDGVLARVVPTAFGDPWTPRWILTPTATVAAHLRVRLAGEAGDGVLGNLRVLPLSRLVERLCESLFGSADPRWSPFLDLLLLDLLENAPAEIVPEPLRKAPENRRLLVPTFLDLAEGGFGSDQAGLLLEVASEPDVGDLSRRVLRCYVAWTELLTAAGHGWQPLQQARLVEWVRGASQRELDRALGTEGDARPEVFLYGFYDFTDLNLELIAALGSRLRVEAFLPGADQPGFDFANAVSRDLALRARVADPVRLGPSDSVARFLLDSFPPARPPDAPPAFLSRHRVSSRFAEALSAAVRALTWCEGPEAMGPHEILIVAPDLEAYEADLRRAFEDFGIPLSMVDLDLSRDGPARPLRWLRRIWEDRAPAEWVLAYLREYPTPARLFGVDVDHFESKIRRLNLGGGTGWRALRDLADGGSERLSAAGVELTPAEVGLVEEIVRRWVEGTRPRQTIPLSEASTLLRGFLAWLPDSEPTARALEEIAGFARLRPSTRVAAGVLLDVVLGSLSSSTGSDRIDASAVVAASVMRARGLVARGVILLGLSADSFPRSVEEDTLLPDVSRARLAGKAGALGHRLPQKGRVLDEMALLFLLLNASAEHIHWVIPETDENGKAVAPTPWVQHYLNRWPPTEGMWRRIPRGPAEQARWLHRLDPERGAFLPPAQAVLIGAVGDSGDGTAEEGVSAEDIPEAVDFRTGDSAQDRGGPKRRRVSVTRLERLARCPFRYWAEAGARLSVLEPLSHEGRPHPRERGGLLHRLLSEVALACRDRGLPLSAGGGFVASLWEGRSGPRTPLETAFLPPVLAAAVRWEMERTLRSYFRAVADGACRDGTPLLTECQVERPAGESLAVTLTGIVDRVDLREDGRCVVDYKSGQNPFGSKPTASREFQLGFHLQPLLYPWLLENDSAAERIRFSYVYLGGDRPKEVEIEADTPPEEILGELLEVLEKGAFVATSNEAFGALGLEEARPCAYCDFASLCRRFDGGGPARGLEELRRLAPRRYAGILAARPGGGQS